MIAIILLFNRRKESSLEEVSSISLLSLCGSQGTRVRPRGPGAAGTYPGGHLPDGLLPPIRVKLISLRMNLPRKEVIQPHLPVRLPCYDFTPLTLHTFGASPLSVGPATSGADDSGGVTGGVYKARERIHRGMLIRDY
jgi:hypothetical protein